MMSALHARRLAAAALLAGGTALTGFGLGTAAAHADTMAQPNQWCPGDPKQMPYIVNGEIDWDWSVCHTWYAVNYGWGNVTMNGLPTSIYDGTDPPYEAIVRRGCPPLAFMCP